MDTNGWNPKPRTNILAPNYIIEEIRDALLNRRLKPGDRLPSELELAELYGVSRGSVRQAMKSLEILGVLTIRPGDGTYVNTTISEKSFNPLVFTLLISGFSDKEIADARYALERDIFELYIDDEKRIETVLPLLEASIAEREELLRTGASPDDLVKNDLAFHRILSRNCGNTLLQIVYDYIMDFFEYYLRYTTALQVENDATPHAHKMVVEALRSHSYAMAKQAAKDSVQIWYDLMTEGIALQEPPEASAPRTGA